MKRLLAIATTALGCGLVLLGGLQAAPTAAMPATQQNALVQEYCGVCHDDAHQNGGLSLQHFDAAHADPGVAAMMLSKLKTGALGAAGVPKPDQATIDAWISATSAEAAGANNWIVNQAPESKTLTVSVVKNVPSAFKESPVPDSYRLTVTCDTATREGTMQLAWSPATPKDGQVMSVAVDGATPFHYTVQGTETMGNGAKGSSGPGAALLYGAKEKGAARTSMRLPEQTLTVSDVLPNETVVFPFRDLAQPVRQKLSMCFPPTTASR